MLLPLHGHAWRQDLGYILGKYDLWSRLGAGGRSGVMIAYASVYGNTENAANILACRLAEQGREGEDVRCVRDATAPMWCPTPSSYSHLVFAAPTYNGGVFITMDELLRDIASHGLQNRRLCPAGKRHLGTGHRPADGRPAGAPEGLAAGGGERDRPFRRPRAPAGGHRAAWPPP